MTIFVYPAEPEFVDLEFTERNAELVRLGIKTCTTRRNAHGHVGSKFLLGGEQYEILAILPTYLQEAAETFYRVEGETSAGAFLHNWASCYRMNPEVLDLRQPVHVHFFGWSPPTSGSALEKP